MGDNDDNELIYIALCNNLLAYNELLENNSLDNENLELAKYIIARTNTLLDKYEEILKGELPIKRPSWTTGQ